MSIINYLKKPFYYPAYSVGYRIINEGDKLPSSSTITPYNSIKPNRREWYADPFPFEHEGRIYIFMEIKDIWKGPACIGVAEIIDGKAQKIKKVLEEPFHLSYPNLFKYEDNIYMLPETSAIRELRLYKAADFPSKWVLDSVLLKGVEYADCSLFQSNDGIYLFCYDTENEKNDLYIYSLEMSEKKLSSVKYNKNNIINQRPAGNLFEYDGIVFRPLQDCSVTYGEKIFLCMMLDNPLTGYKEKLFDTITYQNISLNDNIKYNKIHTLNRSSSIEVIDAGFDKFYWYKMIQKAYSKL